MFLIIEGVGIFRAKQEAQKLRAALWQPRVGTKEGAGDKEKHSPGFAPKPVWPHVHHCLPSPAFIYLECLCYMLFSAPKFLLVIADVTSKSPSWYLLWNKVGFFVGQSPEALSSHRWFRDSERYFCAEELQAGIFQWQHRREFEGQ